MPTVVVLGASSFSGRDFVDLLLKETKHKVVAVSRKGYSKRRSPYRLRRLHPLAYRDIGEQLNEWDDFDLNKDMGELTDELDECRPEMIVNFAAQSEVAPSWDTPEDWFQTNTVALAKLVNHLRKQTYLKKYLHVSSPEIYGSVGGARGGITEEEAEYNPSTPYAASKAAADMLLSCYHRQFGFPLVTVRSTNVYGARQQLWKLIPRTIIAIKQGRKIQLHGGGRAVKSYIHVRDVSRGELAILERGRVGEVYHLSPDKGEKVFDVVRMIAAKMGKSFVDVVENVPERIGQDAAYVIDSSKARTELGWLPSIDIVDGIKETIAWVEENWDAIKDQPLEYSHRP